MSNDLKMTFDNILVTQTFKPIQDTGSGWGQVSNLAIQGEVTAVGPSAEPVKVGDSIVFSQNAGTIIYPGEGEGKPISRIISQREILANGSLGLKTAAAIDQLGQFKQAVEAEFPVGTPIEWASNGDVHIANVKTLSGDIPIGTSSKELRMNAISRDGSDMLIALAKAKISRATSELAA